MDRPPYWIGIDVGSATFTVSVLTQPGERILLLEDVPNTPEGVTDVADTFDQQQITPAL